MSKAFRRSEMLLPSRTMVAEPPASDSARPAGFPTLDVIVPFHNEARFLAEKLANLLRLEYPWRSLRFILVDGQSTDGSLELADEISRGDGRFVVLRAPRANKTLQINLALTRCQADWVLVTDVDAHLPELALHQLMAVAARDPRVAVAGVFHQPERATRLDRLHWRVWNGSRRWERRVGSTSAVLGPCFMFRRDWLRALPDDVVADDMYVSFAALAAGRRIALADSLVIERRSPKGTLAVLFHKLRKGRAFLREVFRFLPGAGRMPAPMRELFLWRTAAAVVAPPLILGAATASLVLAPQASAGFWAFALLCCFVPVETWAPFRGWRRVVTVAALAGLALVLAGVLCVALVSLPLVPQQASFSRWRQEER